MQDTYFGEAFSKHNLNNENNEIVPRVPILWIDEVDHR
jgi:hypothetical protein